MINFLGAIQVGTMYLGRKHFASPNGTYQVIGKLYSIYFYHKIPGNLYEQTPYIGDIDILACVPCANGGEGPCKDKASFD